MTVAKWKQKTAEQLRGQVMLQIAPGASSGPASRRTKRLTA
jgi:hypothetical protein